ncbi:MAG TPA: DsbA family oxidoreductase [Streptosporangiaceae bacterium]|nr:DsbA family oxidoreductase [Streptosporangiaceae bacterium]
MRVDIFSDIICPWCYLGRTRFKEAMAGFDGPVDVMWRPFQLDPAAPATPESATERLAAKFGGPARVAAMHERMRELTMAAGLPYEPERALRANTRDAHRLVWWAGRNGGQDALVDRLFRAYHAEGRDIGDAETLTTLAAESGLAADQVRALLASDEGAAEVARDLEQARALGITGVPFFLFENAWAVAGAQPTDVFSAALREVERNLSATADPLP